MSHFNIGLQDDTAYITLGLTYTRNAAQSSDKSRHQKALRIVSDRRRQFADKLVGCSAYGLVCNLKTPKSFSYVAWAKADYK